MRRAYRFRLRPNGAQETVFRKTAGCCRFVYNDALGQRQRHYEQDGKILWYRHQASRLKELKREPGMEWLCEVPSQCLQQSLLDLDRAYENLFSDVGKYKRGEIKAEQIRLPRPHKKGVQDNFRFPQGFQVERKWVKLPKAGWVRYCDSRPIEGKPKSITVSKDGEHWYMSVLCEIEQQEPVVPTGPAVGLDLNVEEGAAIALSTGENIETAKTSKREQRHLRKLHRCVSRRRPGSANRAKAQKRLSRYQRYLRKRRRDAIHKATTRLAKNYSRIVIENLKMKNLTASARGTLDKPGQNVQAKAGLNRSLLDRAPGMVRLCLEYKCRWYGSTLEKRNPAYTSQRCSQCGHISAENRKSTSLFSCVKCGNTENAHTNAAKNILGGWTDATACGETVRPANAGNLNEAGTQRGAAA